jgi:hypothetical protein
VSGSPFFIAKQNTVLKKTVVYRERENWTIGIFRGGESCDKKPASFLRAFVRQGLLLLW